MVGITHPQLSPSRQLLQSHERPRALKCSFLSGQQEYSTCIASSKAPDRDNSTSPCATCAQDFFVSREPQVSSPLVSGKGNQEYVTPGARSFLLIQTAGQHCLVENASTLRLKESASMGRAWSQGGVQKGSSLYTETFGAEMQITACIQRF